MYQCSNQPQCNFIVSIFIVAAICFKDQRTLFMALHNFAWVIVVAIVVVHIGACTFGIIFKVPVWQLV